LLSLLVILLYRRGPGEKLVFAARSPAAESVVALVATTLPVVEPPASTVSPSSAVEPPRATASRPRPLDGARGAASSLSISAAKREKDRSPPVRMSSELAVSRPEKSLLLDDALTDQK
jgi:hypothetical protein